MICSRCKNNHTRYSWKPKTQSSLYWTKQELCKTKWKARLKMRARSKHSLPKPSTCCASRSSWFKSCKTNYETSRTNHTQNLKKLNSLQGIQCLKLQQGCPLKKCLKRQRKMQFKEKSLCLNILRCQVNPRFRYQRLTCTRSIQLSGKRNLSRVFRGWLTQQR